MLLETAIFYLGVSENKQRELVHKYFKQTHFKAGNTYCNVMIENYLLIMCK